MYTKLLKRAVHNWLIIYAIIGAAFILSMVAGIGPKYVTKAFDDTVVEYLKSEISSHYSSIVDMDILSALEREAKYL